MRRRRTRHRGLAAALVACLLLILLVGIGLLYVRTRTAEEQVRAFVERALARELDLPVRLGGFSLSPGVGRVDLRRLTIVDRSSGAPLLEVDRVRVSLALLALLGGELRVRAIEVREPRLTVEDTPLFRTLLGGLAARMGELPRGSEGEGVPVRLEGGTVRYRAPTLGVSLEAAGIRGGLAWAGRDTGAVAVTADDIRAEVGGRRLAGVRLDARARLGRELTEVEQIRLERGGSVLTLTGVVLAPPGLPRVELTVAGELALGELGSVLADGAAWDGKLSVGGKLFGEGWPSTFEGRLALADGRLAGMPARLLTANVLLRPDRLEVISLSARAGGGSLSGAGVFEPREARWRARAQLTDVSLTSLFQMLGRPGWLTGRIGGSIEGTGRGADATELTLRGRLAGRELRLPDQERAAEGELRGEVHQGTLTVERLTLARGESRLALDGVADLKTGALRLQVKAAIADLAGELWPVHAQGLAGTLRLVGRVGGTLGAPALTGQVSARNLGFRGWRADRVEGPLEADLRGVASRGLRLGAGRTEATVAGTARLADPTAGWGRWREALRLDIRTDLKGRIEELAAWSQQGWPVAGPIFLRARLGGTPSALEGGGQLSMRELRLGTERLEGLEAALLFREDKLTVPRLTARREGVPLEAEGAIDLDGRYRFSLLPVPLDLARLRELAPVGARGAARLRLRGAGRLPELAVEGEARLSDVAFQDVEVGAGSLRFATDRRKWRWEASLALGVSARGVIPLALRGPLQAEVTVADFDLAPWLRKLDEALPFTLAARADGRATVGGSLPDLAELTAEIELTGLRGRAGDVPWRARETARLRWEAGTLRLESVELEGPDLRVSLSGRIRPGAEVDLVLAGHAPFPLVRSWVPPVTDLRGAPEVRVSLSGPAEGLRVAGRAELRRVDVKLQAVPLWLSVTGGEVRFGNDSLAYVVHAGTAAGGRLEGKGTARREGDAWRHALEFRLDRARMDSLYEQYGSRERWASGDLFARGTLSFEAAPDEAALATLGGRLSVRLEGGTLSRYPALVRIFGLLGTPAQPLRLPDLTRERMPFRQISADFTVREGVLETQNLLLDSEVVRVSGVGRLRLADETVDFDLGVRPLQVLEQGIRRIPLLGRLLPQEQSLVVTYFDMTGPWRNPSISVAPVKSFSETVVDILLLLLKAPARVVVPGR